MTPAQAAANTWTGMIAADYGYTTVVSVTDSYGSIVVIFGK